MVVHFFNVQLYNPLVPVEALELFVDCIWRRVFNYITAVRRQWHTLLYPKGKRQAELAGVHFTLDSTSAARARPSSC